MSNHYNPAWFANFQDQTVASARAVVPLVLDLLPVHSVVDVGCGTGGWLAVFSEHSITDIHGVDGPWVDAKQLLIPAESFHPTDLMQPFKIEQHADLAVSLEVAEHLPATMARLLVENLTNIAPVVLFSAAIPFQGGTGHVNEQWPAYWAQIFSEFGFVPVDCLRRRVWDNERVRYWYAQNMFLYVKASELHRFPKLSQERELGCRDALALVHPTKYLSLYKPKASIGARVFNKLKRIWAASAILGSRR